MNSILVLLEKHYDVDIEQANKCCSIILDYMFRCLSSEGMKAELESRLKPKSAYAFRDFQDDLSDSGYLYKNVKLWLFYLLKNRVKRLTLTDAHKFEVQTHDFVLFDLINYRTRNTIKGWGKSYKSLTLRKMDSHLNRMAADPTLQTWVSKFVYRKLRFIADSQSMELTDLERELWLKGMSGLFMLYPRIENLIHATNIIKRVMHNHGMNMIKQYTHAKRSRLQRNADGTFSSVNIDFALLDLETDDTTDLSDIQMDVHKVVKSVDGKEKSLLHILCGIGIEENRFYEYLNSIGIKSEPDTLIKRIGLWGFLKHAAQFLTMTFNGAVRFVKSLQYQLREYAI